MANYLGSRLLMIHIDQYLSGVSPGGAAGMAEFFMRHHIRPADVATALEVAGRGDAETVRIYVEDNPVMNSWYHVTPGLAPAQAPLV